MFSESFKSKILKIIPPHSFLRKILKKIYQTKCFLYPLKVKCLLFLFEIRNFIFSQKPIKVEVDDVSFKLVPKGEEAFNYWAGLRFERHELEFILNQVRPKMIFFDLGSNVGLFALAVASKYKDIKIYGFEPSSQTFQILQENVRVNGLSNLIPCCTALGDYRGKSLLQISKPWSDGLNTIGQPSHPGFKIIGQEQVPITTLDNFVETNNIPRVDLIKVDIEGAELLAFRGAKKLLQRQDAPLILYESRTFTTKGFGYHPVEIMWFLKDLGYFLFELNEGNGKITPYSSEGRYDTTIIAVKPNHPSFKWIKQKSQ